MATKLNESTEFSIPLKSLISLIAAVAVGVWVYFAITERITFLEHTVRMLQEEIKDHDDWINNFQPPKEVQVTVDRVRELELRLLELEVKSKE